MKKYIVFALLGFMAGFSNDNVTAPAKSFKKKPSPKKKAALKKKSPPRKKSIRRSPRKKTSGGSSSTSSSSNSNSSSNGSSSNNSNNNSGGGSGSSSGGSSQGGGSSSGGSSSGPIIPIVIPINVPEDKKNTPITQKDVDDVFAGIAAYGKATPEEKTFIFNMVNYTKGPKIAQENLAALNGQKTNKELLEYVAGALRSIGSKTGKISMTMGNFLNFCNVFKSLGLSQDKIGDFIDSAGYFYNIFISFHKDHQEGDKSFIDFLQSDKEASLDLRYWTGLGQLLSMNYFKAIYNTIEIAKNKGTLGTPGSIPDKNVVKNFFVHVQFLRKTKEQNALSKAVNLFIEDFVSNGIQNDTIVKILTEDVLHEDKLKDAMKKHFLGGKGNQGVPVSKESQEKFQELFPQEQEAQEAEEKAKKAGLLVASDFSSFKDIVIDGQSPGGKTFLTMMNRYRQGKENMELFKKEKPQVQKYIISVLSNRTASSVVQETKDAAKSAQEKHNLFPVLRALSKTYSKAQGILDSNDYPSVLSSAMKIYTILTADGGLSENDAVNFLQKMNTKSKAFWVGILKVMATESFMKPAERKTRIGKFVEHMMAIESQNIGKVAAFKNMVNMYLENWLENGYQKNNTAWALSQPDAFQMGLASKKSYMYHTTDYLTQHFSEKRSSKELADKFKKYYDEYKKYDDSDLGGSAFAGIVGGVAKKAVSTAVNFIPGAKPAVMAGKLAYKAAEKVM